MTIWPLCRELENSWFRFLMSRTGYYITMPLQNPRSVKTTYMPITHRTEMHFDQICCNGLQVQHVRSFLICSCKQVQVNLCQKLLFLQNMRRTYCVQKLFLMSDTISVHNMFSPSLSLEFSCIDLAIPEMPLGFQIRVGQQ